MEKEKNKTAHEPMTAADRPCTGNADDIGDTWGWPFALALASSLMEFGPSVALGVCGAPVATFPMNHDCGTKNQ